MDTALNVQSAEYHQAMGALLGKALESPEGLRALAAAVAEPIEQAIETTEIGSLLLTKHNLPVGERAVYQKRPTVKAYWISPRGEAVQSTVDDVEEVEIPTGRIASTPMIDIGVLKHGNVGTINDLQQQAADEIRKKIDKRVIDVVSAAVPTANIVEQTGTTLLEATLNQALSLLEDKELTPKTILLRGKRFADMRTWDLDPQTQNELRLKGFVKVYGGADIVMSSSIGPDEIIILPDVEVGKMPIRTKLTVQPVDQPLVFKTGWLVYLEIGMGVLRPDCIAKIKILG